MDVLPFIGNVARQPSQAEKGEPRASHQQQAGSDQQHTDNNQKLAKLERNHIDIVLETGSHLVAPIPQGGIGLFSLPRAADPAVRGQRYARLASPDSRPFPPQVPALSPLGERVDRTGVFFSRGGPGEGVVSLRPLVQGSQLAANMERSIPGKKYPISKAAVSGASEPWTAFCPMSVA